VETLGIFLGLIGMRTMQWLNRANRVNIIRTCMWAPLLN